MLDDRAIEAFDDQRALSASGLSPRDQRPLATPHLCRWVDGKRFLKQLILEYGGQFDASGGVGGSAGARSGACALSSPRCRGLKDLGWDGTIDSRFRWIRDSQEPSPVFLARVQLRELSRSEVHPAGALAATFLLRWRGWQGTRG